MSQSPIDRPTAPRRRALLWLGGGLGALACVCIIALSAWLYVNDDALTAMKQLLGLGAEPRAAQFLPASTLVFVSVNPSFPQLASFAKLRTVFEKNPTYAKKLNDLAQANTPGNGVQFERDVLPWLGSEAAIAVLDFQPPSSNSSGKTPHVVFMAATRDKTKSDEAIARVRGAAAEQAWTFDEETYKGVVIATSKPPAGANGPRTQGGAFTTFQGWVLYGTDAETIKQVIDTRLAGAQSSLAQNVKYRTIQEKLPKERAAALFTDLGALIKQSSPQDVSQSEEFDTVQGLGVAVSFADDGIRFDYYSAIDQQRTPESYKQLLASYRPNAGRILESLPDSTIFVLGAQDLKSQWDYHSGIWKRDPKMHFQQTLDDIKQSTSIDLDEDVFAWLTGEYALALLPTQASGPDLMLLVEAKDQALVARTMGKIAAVSYPVGGPSKQVSGIELHPILPGGLVGPGGTYYGFLDKDLLIGTSADSFAMLVDAHGAPLTRDLDFTHALKPLPQPNIGVTYLSIPRLVEVLRPLAGSTFSTEVEPLLKPFKALSIAFGVPNADGQAATLYVYVSE